MSLIPHGRDVAGLLLLALLTPLRAAALSAVAGGACNDSALLLPENWLNATTIHDIHPASDMANAVLADPAACATLCCQTPGCAGFLFDGTPSSAASPNCNCTAGNDCSPTAGCCWLKPTVDPYRHIHNTTGVTSGIRSPKPGCQLPIEDKAWSPLWLQSFHPVTPGVTVQGDSCGGLHVNGTWHVMTSCHGGWSHLTTTDLVHYTFHGQIPHGTGTGSVVPSPDGKGVLGFVNDVAKHMVSIDGMQTWESVNTTTMGSPGGRDQARPLQSADGSWFQMMGCGLAHAAGGAVCRFKATDNEKLSAWEFAGYLWQSNHTVFGARFVSRPEQVTASHIACNRVR